MREHPVSSAREPNDLPRRTVSVLLLSREEPRLHVHDASGEGEAKFWIDPGVELAENFGIPQHEIARVQGIVTTHENEIREAWKRHFGR